MDLQMCFIVFSIHQIHCPVFGLGDCSNNMPDSDDDYIEAISDDEAEAHQVTRGAGHGTRASGQRHGGGRRAMAGFEVTRTWENVVEGADGTISSTVEGMLEAGKRRR